MEKISIARWNYHMAESKAGHTEQLRPAWHEAYRLFPCKERVVQHVQVTHVKFMMTGRYRAWVGL